LSLPIFLVVFGFDFLHAVTSSLSCVFGNILSQFIVNFARRHPRDQSYPVIDWSVLLVLLPAQLGGASIGVVLADILPSTILEIVAIVAFCFSSYKTILKARELWDQETIAMAGLLETEEPLLESAIEGKEIGKYCAHTAVQL
jgi:uncharacterized membrane protein YfcA